MSTNGFSTPARQHAQPLWLDRLEKPGTATALEPFGIDDGAKAYSEGWLQEVIFRFPQVLPVAEIEPAFGPLFAVCTELPTPSGYADNLFVTGNGNLVVVECKLWRNPEARRQVVAQIIDYAHAMAGWTYEDLEQAIRRAGAPEGCERPLALYELFGDSAELDEADFVDAVSRNLRLGRMLLLLLGDGIREGVESLSTWLQAHAGFHFTLGMVELTLFRLPAGGFVMQPRILARTVNIERGILRIEEGRITVEAPPTATASSPGKRTSISQEMLLERVAEVEPDLPAALDRFLEGALPLNIVLESASKSLQLRWHGPDDTVFALGGVNVQGELLTYNVNWVPLSIGRLDLARDYLSKLAHLLGCEVRKAHYWYLVVPGTTRQPKAMPLLQRPTEWLALLADYTTALEHALSARRSTATMG